MPADDQGRGGALLDAVEPGQIAFEEAGQAVRAVSDGVGGDGGVVQEGLSLGVIQERHLWDLRAVCVYSTQFRI